MGVLRCSWPTAAQSENTMELSNTIRSSIIDRVLVLLQKEILSMEHSLKVVEDLFFGVQRVMVAVQRTIRNIGAHAAQHRHLI